MYQVTRFLESPDLQLGTTSNGNPPATSLIDANIKQRLLRHIDSCISEIDLDFSLATMKTTLDPETDNRLDRIEEMLMNGKTKIKSEPADNDEVTKPDSSTVSPGDENNNSNNGGKNSKRKLISSNKNKKNDKKITVTSTKSLEPATSCSSSVNNINQNTATSSQTNLSVVQVSIIYYFSNRLFGQWV